MTPHGPELLAGKKVHLSICHRRQFNSEPVINTAIITVDKVETPAPTLGEVLGEMIDKVVAKHPSGIGYVDQVLIEIDPKHTPNCECEEDSGQEA